MLRAAVNDLHHRHIPVLGLSPTARAAQVLHDETGVHTDTVAKLLYEYQRPGGPGPSWNLGRGLTVIVDEAGMLSTPDLHHLTSLASRFDWRLALVGDHRQLQAVHRGGMFAELCTTTTRDPTRRDPPVPRTMGSRRVAAAAHRQPERDRSLRTPRPDHLRHPRRTPRPHRHDLDRQAPRTGTPSLSPAASNEHVDAINTRDPTSTPPRRHDPSRVHARAVPMARSTSATRSRPARTCANSSPPTVSQSTTGTCGPRPRSPTHGDLTVRRLGSDAHRDPPGRVRS